MVAENYAVFCNSKAGKGSALKVLPAFEDFLTERKIAFEIFTDRLPITLTGFTCLVIMGGDGTVNYVINHFKSIAIPMAFIPCGTGNDYPGLHVGSNRRITQFEIACGTRVIEADAGKCNGRLFINGVGIGFDGWVVKRNLGKQLFSGHLAYLSTIVSLLLFYKEKPVSIEADGLKLSDDIFLLTIAKGRTYGGGFTVAPLAHPTDGFFDFVAVKKIGLLKRFRYLPVIEKGKHLILPFVVYKKTGNIKVKSDYMLQAHLDGEWMESKEFNIEILKKAFKIKSAL